MRTLLLKYSFIFFSLILSKLNVLNASDIRLDNFHRMKFEIVPFVESYGELRFFEGSGGAQVGYYYFDHQVSFSESEKSKGAVLISIGAAEYYEKYYEMIYDLAQKNYDPIIVYEHRGQGHSERLYKKDSWVGHVESYLHYVNDFLFFLRKVVLWQDFGKKIMIGQGLGATILSSSLLESEDQLRNGVISKENHIQFDAAFLMTPHLEVEKPIFSNFDLESVFSKFHPKDDEVKSVDQGSYFKNYEAQNPEIKINAFSQNWFRQVDAGIQQFKKNFFLLRKKENHILVIEGSNDDEVDKKFFHALSLATSPSSSIKTLPICGGKRGLHFEKSLGKGELMSHMFLFFSHPEGYQPQDLQCED